MKEAEAAVTSSSTSLIRTDSAAQRVVRSNCRYSKNKDERNFK